MMFGTWKTLCIDISTIISTIITVLQEIIMANSMTKVGSCQNGLENRVVSMWSRKIPLVRMVQDDMFRKSEGS